MEKRIYAYIGSWAVPGSNAEAGITVAEYQPQFGGFKAGQHIFSEISCGAACLDKKRMVLYCVDERTEVPGKTLGGQVYALKIDPQTGSLSQISCTPSYGTLPSYCALDGSGRYLIVTHHAGSSSITKTVQDPNGDFRIVREYDETSVVLFPLDETGRIEPPCDIIRHTGHGLLPSQNNPHAHCVKADPSGRLFAVCDKGNDSLYFYRIDSENRKLVCCDRIDGVPGSSPRYCVFHPTLPYLYYNNETMDIVNMVGYDKDGKLTPVCAIGCTQEGARLSRGQQSDLVINSSGSHLYTLVRENSTIAVYHLDEESGVPTLRQIVPCGSSRGGRWMALSPDERYLHMASCPDAEIYTFPVSSDGLLERGGIALKDVSPSAIVFV